jgi:hypothetical protein
MILLEHHKQAKREVDREGTDFPVDWRLDRQSRSIHPTARRVAQRSSSW